MSQLTIKDESQREILGIFQRTGALLSGHFVLRSGLHSGHYFQCAQVCQHMDKVTRLIELLRPIGIVEMVRTGQVSMTRGVNDGVRRMPGMSDRHYEDVSVAAMVP